MIINPYRFAGGGAFPDDPIAEYLFTTNADDTSGNGYDGTLQSNATASGGVLTLDGSGDHVAIADADVFSFTNGSTDTPCTISMWFKCTEAIGSGQRLLTKFNSSANKKEWYLTIGGAGTITMVFQEYNSGDVIYATTASTYTQNSWHHAVVTYDGSESETGINMYFDNSLDNDVQGEAGTYTGMTNTSAEVRIGARGSGLSVSNEFQGDMDNVRIYDRELTTDEITELYNEGHS